MKEKGEIREYKGEKDDKREREKHWDTSQGCDLFLND